MCISLVVVVTRANKWRIGRLSRHEGEAEEASRAVVNDIPASKFHLRVMNSRNFDY